MQKNKKFSDEDATYEALILNRSIEDTYVVHGEDYDSRYAWPTCSRRYESEQVTYRDKLGRLHRQAGPAIKSEAAGYEFWYKEGIRHRDGGPAYIHKHIQKWYVNGKLHRLDGPAIIGKGRPKEYWIEGQKLSPKEFKKEVARRKSKGHYVLR